MKQHKKISLLQQMALIFLVGLIAISAISSYALYRFSNSFVRSSLAESAKAITADLSDYIYQYPAHDWLFRYWFENYDRLDIEYDAGFSKDTRTSEKCRILLERHPEFQLEYAETSDVEALPEEDQKLYAEIVYSWLITRIDQMEAAFDTDYFLCIVSEEPYDRQFVLFIAAGEGEVRGNGPGEIFPIGRNYPASEEQTAAMRSTANGNPRGAYSKDGKFLDYYTYLGSVDEHQLMLVIARDITKVQDEIVYRIIQFGTMLLLFILVLAVLCLLTIQFVALRPLKKIQESINLYRITKDNEAVRKTLREVKSDNELGILSDDVAAMADEIDAYTERIEAITSERERIDVELSLASRIQQAMLPKKFPEYPERKDYEIYASMTPAKEVGGDFYDFFLVDDTHLCILIADVSGKGIPASLYMMASKISLSHHIKTGKQPAEVFEAVNRAICEHNPEEMFVTAWIGILDLTTGKMAAANAGHENPMLMQPDKPYVMFRDVHGFVLGGMPDVKYREYEIEMKPGARLFLYTDGLMEAMNNRDEMFGMDRILDELNRTRNERPKVVLEDMKNTVDRFAEGREPFDDLTMISLVYHGPLMDHETEKQ